MLVGAIAVQIFVLRLRREAREARARRIRARWEPFLLGAVAGEAVGNVPRLLRGEEETFLMAWNRTLETLKGPVRDRLADLARRAGAEETVRRWLRGRGVRRKLIAIQTAGSLRDEGSTKELQRILRRGDSYLSLWAARSLVRIDPALAGTVIVPLIPVRPDWPFVRLAKILRTAGQANFSASLAETAGGVPVPARPLVARLLAEARPGDALPVLRRFLAEAEDPECTAACLQSIGRFRSPPDIPLLRRGLSHPSWVVRMHAAVALGSVGIAEDVEPLSALLGDPEWWVRYRAAGALLRLPGMDTARLARLRADHPDRYGRDALRMVIAEAGAR